MPGATIAKQRHGPGAWAAIVRADYRKGKLSPERIHALNELGFAWRIKK